MDFQPRETLFLLQPQFSQRGKGIQSPRSRHSVKGALVFSSPVPPAHGWLGGVQWFGQRRRRGDPKPENLDGTCVHEHMHVCETLGKSQVQRLFRLDAFGYK